MKKPNSGTLQKNNSELMDVSEVRRMFPALELKVHGEPLVYLDSGATTLKPRVVIERIKQYYSFETSNVHRGAHYLADLGTQMYESTRNQIAGFLNAQDSKEIIFVRGTTEGINLVAQSFGASLKKGDKILLSILEHHSNIVPWQVLAKQRELKIEFVDILDSGHLNMVDYKNKVKDAKLIAVTACSNVLGTIPDLKAMIRIAHDEGAVILIDGAQIVAHQPVDLKDLDCDFFVCSAHKMYGPTGIGILFGKLNLLEKMPPYQTGGSMIIEVTQSGSTFLPPPQRFEAGTPHISGVAGFSEAVSFIQKIGFDKIRSHDKEISDFCFKELSAIPDLKIFGGQDIGQNIKPDNRIGIFSFNLKGLHHMDVGNILDQQGIAVRVGHHCTQPLMRRLSLTGTVRASLGLYNSKEDIVKLVSGTKKAKELLS